MIDKEYYLDEAKKQQTYIDICMAAIKYYVLHNEDNKNDDKIVQTADILCNATQTRDYVLKQAKEAEGEEE